MKSIIIGIIGLTWIFSANDLALTKIFSPAQEQVRRETFEKSKAYNQGMVQELNKAYQDYSKGSEVEKDAIKSIVLHQYADYDTSNLPVYLQTFLAELRK